MSDPATSPPEPLRCSARGCTRTAEFAVRWNNPKLHPPERRKTWLACPEHRQSLSDFLAARGFLRDVESLESLDPLGRLEQQKPIPPREP